MNVLNVKTGIIAAGVALATPFTGATAVDFSSQQVKPIAGRVMGIEARPGSFERALTGDLLGAAQVSGAGFKLEETKGASISLDAKGLGLG